MLIGQVLYLIRRFGFFHLAKLKRRHDEALPFLRGYAATSAIWALTNVGFLDDLAREGPVRLNQYASGHGLDQNVLHALCEYLDCLGIVRLEGGVASLQPKGHHFIREARGDFDLAKGYEPVFASLEALLRGSKKYGADIFRLGDFIARGSGELGAQLPFPIMKTLIGKYRLKRILDLGCGDLEFLFTLCQDPELKCWGIDNSLEAVSHAQKRLALSHFRERIIVRHLDMFDVAALKEFAPEADCLTAVDVFHEYLSEGTERIREFLSSLRQTFPRAHLVVAEFCEQPLVKLRRRPTAFLEHHLFHSLTRQVILRAPEWAKLFESAGFAIQEKRIFDLVGHGYFVLR